MYYSCTRLEIEDDEYFSEQIYNKFCNIPDVQFLNTTQNIILMIEVLFQ